MPTMIQLVDGTVPVAADFNGNFTALNNAIGASTTISGYATGDTLYASTTNTLGKLPIGTSGQVLTVSAGIPSWASSSSLTPGAGRLAYVSATQIKFSPFNGSNVVINRASLAISSGGVTAPNKSIFLYVGRSSKLSARPGYFSSVFSQGWSVCL